MATARLAFGRPDGDSPRRALGTIVAPEKLDHIRPGITTYNEVVRLCGTDAEERRQLGAPHRRTLVYRGRRLVPQRRPIFAWLATVSHWDSEEHEVEIELDHDVVSDVQARVRRARLAQPETG
jgi:hypothetical protein